MTGLANLRIARNNRSQMNFKNIEEAGVDNAGGMLSATNEVRNVKTDSEKHTGFARGMLRGAFMAKAMEPCK
jgi:hypothetical protein